MMESSPRDEYQERLRRREAEAARLERLDRRFGDARLAVFAVGLIVAWPTAVSRTWDLGWLAIPPLAFVSLVVLHVPVARRLDRVRLGVIFYRRGLARLTGDLADPLDDGTRFRDAEHPYAEDLDLFGAGSLYALLCTARSLPGREALAEWLVRAAPPREIGARQQAVEELRRRLDLREDLAVLAADLSPEVSAGELDRWGRAAPLLAGLAVPLAAGVLGAIHLAAVAAWLFGPLATEMLLPLFVPGGLVALALRSRVSRVLEGLAVPAEELRFLAAALARLEAERFAGDRLRELQGSAVDSPVRPSERLAGLARLIEWNDSRRNQLFLPLASLLLAGTQLAFAVERWRARNGAAIGEWLRALGQVEALSAFASFSYENPDYRFPEIVSGPPRFESVRLAHPLLPRGRRVANDVQLGGGQRSAPRLLLVSGSNMSGKSTLLRSVGVAAVLAFAGAPVAAESLRISPLAVGASLQVHDSLLEGVSRFYAELRKLRRISRLASDGPTLFLLDEVLQGTNSHDRRIGAGAVLRGLLDAGAIGIVTTHDLALAEIAEELAPEAANVHFEDHLEEGRMAFDYRLRPGVVERGNALALMRTLKLPVPEE